jgi:hypothetical protein
MPERREHDGREENDGLWSEAMWSAGLVGSVLVAIWLLTLVAA